MQPDVTPASAGANVDSTGPAGLQPRPGRAEVEAPRDPPLSLVPLGFTPDAVGFALRTALAVLLAYYAAFFAQVEAASSAGVCVAIVAQPAAGWATS